MPLSFGFGKGSVFRSSPSALSVVTDSLRVHLDASNPSSYGGSGTTWTDLSGNSKNATLNAGMTYNSANGGFIQFNAVNQYATIAVGSLATINTSAYTKMVWFKLTSYSTYNNLISGESGASHVMWAPDYFGSISRKITCGHNNFWQYVVGTTTILTNTWYCSAVTFSSTTGWALYLNGTLQASNTIDKSGPNGSDPVYLGTFAGLGNGIVGGMGSVYIYGKSLTQAEITQNFDATKTRFGL